MMSGAMNHVERRGEVVGFVRGVARVRMEVEAACASCGSRSTCSTGKTQVVELSLPQSARIGDQVAVTMPAASITQAALLGYMLPPSFLLLGAYLASSVYPGDAAAVLGAIFGFAAGLLVVRQISERMYHPEFTSAVCAADSPQLPNAERSNRFQSGETL